MKKLSAALLPLLLVCACTQSTAGHESAAQAAKDAAARANAPQSATEKAAPQEWSKGAMIAAADERAVDAGLAILAEGGNAIDAAIAVHSVLGLVEPQSSGLGGGAFMVYYDRAADELTVFDGRELAPASTTPEHFIKDGEVLGFLDAWQSGKAVGVPGQVALYKAAHEHGGSAAWESLFAPAITLAEEGFKVSPRLNSSLSSERLRAVIQLDDNPDSAPYFYPDGEPLPVGFNRTNPEYANTLKRVASEGPSAFYEGDIAEGIVAAVNAGDNGGDMTAEDLKNYTVRVRPALCGDIPQNYRLCSAPPPSSGGVTQIMIPNLYAALLPTDTGAIGEDDRLKAYVDAQRLAYADRDHYVADADIVSVPADDLINPIYIKARAKQAFAPDAPATAGDPGLVLGRGPIKHLWGSDETQHAPGTTHLSIVDQYGNAVSMTATVEAAFGSSRMTNGFLLNNELTDFSRNPVKNGIPVANAPAANKRPRSSMSPTIIFDPQGDLFMVTGSPGGNSIIAYVSKTVLGVVEWGLTAQQSADTPNIIARGDSVGVEVDTNGGPEAADALRQMGYDVKERRGENSGLHVIVVREDGLEGAADTRREGKAKSLQ